MRVGGLLQILSITVAAVRSVLAGGDAPGGHPDSTYPDGLMPEEDRWTVRRALQAGTAYHGKLTRNIPEDT